MFRPSKVEECILSHVPFSCDHFLRCWRSLHINLPFWNVPALVLITLTRGRTKITKLLMSYYTDLLRPPVSASDLPELNGTSIGNPQNDTDYNPCPAVIEAVQYHQDSHVPKALPTLIFVSQSNGDKGLEQLLDVPPRWFWGWNAQQECCRGYT